MFGSAYVESLPAITVGWWKTQPVGATFDVCLAPETDNFAGPARVALQPCRRRVEKTGECSARVDGVDRPHVTAGYTDWRQLFYALTAVRCDTCIAARSVNCRQTKYYHVVPFTQWPNDAALFVDDQRTPCARWEDVDDTLLYMDDGSHPFDGSK